MNGVKSKINANVCTIQTLKDVQSHSGQFDVKQSIVVKLTEFFTVVVIGIMDHNVYSANIDILFTIQNEL